MDNSSLIERWENFIEETKANGSSRLGKCTVDMTVMGDDICLILTDGFGSGFEMMLPGELPPEAKATLLLFHRDFSAGGNSVNEITGRNMLLEGFEDFLLPSISEELRETVRNIESIDVVMSIMCYLDMISDAMAEHDVEEVSLGRDGAIYINEDMPYTLDEIFDDIAEMTNLDDDTVLMIMKWIPMVAISFEGTFPGMLSTRDGFSANIKSVDPDLSSSFSVAMADMWEEESGIVITPDDIAQMSRMKTSEEMREFYSNKRIVSKVAVEDFIDLMSLNGFPIDEVNLIRITLLNIFSHAGKIVDFRNMIPASDEDSIQMVIDNICCTIDANRGREGFMWTYGAEGVAYCNGDGNDEEGDG